MDEVQIQRTALIGWGMTFLGILLVSLSNIFAAYLGNWFNSALSDIGTGLIAAGILTTTLESANQRRHKALQIANQQRHERDISELKDAHFESVLKGFMDVKIFEQIQSSIIGVPFRRTNFQGVLNLEWLSGEKEYLIKFDSATYEVENISKTIEEYRLRVTEEKPNEHKFPNSTKIKSVRVKFLEGERKGQEMVYTEEEISNNDRLEVTDQYIRIVLPINIQPKERFKVSLSVESILRADDIYDYLINTPTTELEVIVSHPEDLEVRASLHHPHNGSFSPRSDGPTMKTFELDEGLLPYQGIRLNWQKAQQ